MATNEVTIQIKESQASRPYIEVFEGDQKLWEVFKFAEDYLGPGCLLWNVNTQDFYMSGTKAMKKSLNELGLTGDITFMGVRKDRIPRVAPSRPPPPGVYNYPGPAGMQPGPPAESLEERKEKVKQVLKEKREEAMAVASEEAREKELERRRIGQELMKEKIKKEREEMKKVSESISRRKAQRQSELENIRLQIAKDKELRKREKEGIAALVTEVKPVVKPPQQDGKVKMKIRVGDATLLKTFEQTELLSVVLNYVQEEIKGNVVLSNTYPRKQYSEEDLTKSLAALGLSGNVSLVGRSA